MSDLVNFPQHGPSLKLLSIHSVYVDRIRDGSKTVELRTRNPGLYPGDWCAAYETKPAQQIATVFQASGFWCLSPEDAWKMHHDQLGIEAEDFFRYFYQHKYAYGVMIDQVVSFEPIPIQRLQADLGFAFPQGCPKWNHKRIYKRLLDAIKD